MFASEKETVSCSRMSKLVKIGKESMSTIANCFAKHSEKVCKRFYVQHYSERAAARISWECYQRYKPQEDLKKASQFKSAALQNKAMPSSRIIKKWIQDLIDRIRLHTNVTIEDGNLVKELSKLGKEQGIA